MVDELQSASGRRRPAESATTTAASDAAGPDGVSVVVPVYQSAATLRELVERLAAVLDGSGRAFEVLLVNDGSEDESWQVILDLRRRHPFVHGIDLLRNHGQHNALLCGIRAARHPVIVTLDDDLQNPPEEIPLLLDRLDRGADVVYGVPRREQHGILRNLASKSTKWAMESFLGTELPRKISAFRAFRTNLRRAFASYQGTFVSIDVLLSWGTRRFDAVVVRHEPRAAGRSSYGLRRLTTHALNMMTGFSVLPLQLASWTGFACTAFGLVVLMYVLVSYLLRGSAVPGFAFLASIIVIFSGAQLFALGIVGEYLARMHVRLLDRPSYTIRTSTEGLEANVA